MNAVTEKLPTENKLNTVVAAAPRALKPIDSVRDTLEKMKGQFNMVLPKHITPDRMVRIALNACQNNPKLLECDKKSFFAAIMRAAQLGLEPDGILGQAYLIPYGDKVQFIPGYKGLIDLARRSGEVSNIIAREVCANDEFTVDFSQEIPFTHKPLLTGDRGTVTHFWAMARFKDGGFHWDYLSTQEVEAIRDKSQGWTSAKKYGKEKESPWGAHFNEMGKKTAIRRIAKYLPMSVQKATIAEDLVDAGKQFSTTDFGDIVIEGDVATVDDNQKKIGNDAVKEKLKKKAAKEAGADPETGEIIESNTDNSPSNDAKKQEVKETTQAVLFDQMATKFVADCNAAKAITDLAMLKHNNRDLLADLKEKNPPKYNFCADGYNERIVALNGNESQMMEGI